MIYETYSAEETAALGEKLGREAKPGDVCTLMGDLGVGADPGDRKGTRDHGADLKPDVHDRAGLRGRTSAVLPF